MIVKAIELRDRMTLIPAIAIKLRPENEKERRILAHAGFGGTIESQEAYVMLSALRTGQITYDTFAWNDRTFHVAHEYIEKHFDELKSGDVVDVQFILGETKEPAVSEYNEPSFIDGSF